MTRKPLISLAALLAFAPTVFAQLPYNPTQLFLSPNGTKVYQISPQASQIVLSYLDISTNAESSSQTTTINANLPFGANAVGSITAVQTENGFSVVAGNCQDTSANAQLWNFIPDKSEKNGTWEQLKLSSSASPWTANYLSAGFSFSADPSTNDTAFYVFGGMCPDGPSNSTDWTSQASYSDALVSASLDDAQTYYDIQMGQAPPIAEAGLTITPLSPIFSNSSTGKISQQQNFVLLGGHTQNAFINMSQVALFSLPEAAWAFVGVDQSSTTQGELTKRDGTTVEPRSGHSAVLSEDGSQVIVLGGWVGDVTNPAKPQLAVLEIGDNYGGTGSWKWTIPSQTASPFTSGQGIFGHGAVMLPGGIMMVSGGTILGQSTSKRATGQNFMFYNTTSATWISTYKNSNTKQSSANSTSHKLNSSLKAGVGAGVGLGIAAIIAIAACWFLYSRKLKHERVERERRLREQALGSGRHQSYVQLPIGVEGRGGYPEMRSASWGSAQERHVEGHGNSFPWAPVMSHGQAEAMRMEREEDHTDADYPKVLPDVPSPTSGLRRSLHSRGPAGFGNHFGPRAGPGGVFRIDEEEEGSVKSGRAQTPSSRLSDPFKDPPAVSAQDLAAEKRKREVQGWVEDWQSAAESLTLSRNPSHARTHSMLSQAQSHPSSPDKSDHSDRTGSNLSEKSNFSVNSFQKSFTGSVSRSMSQRSASAGVALFTGAAAAMSKLAGLQKESSLDRSASKRSVSLNSAHPRTTRPISAEGKSLLRDQSPTKSDHQGYWTPPESPIKDYKNYARTSSMTSQGRSKTRGVLGSFKRVLTGTSQVDIQAQVETYEEKEKEVDVPLTAPEITEMLSHPLNPAVPFWQNKQGAQDWNEQQHLEAPASSTIRRRSAGKVKDDYQDEEYDGEDWDVETAVQKRVVQVMFTVPKEKLRVVNADSLSLISRSDVGNDEIFEAEMKRMSSVREGEDEITDEKGKGKEVEE